MLLQFLQQRGSMSPLDLLFLMLGYAVILFLCLPVHEFAHGLMAHWCGDDTAKWYGRLTLNPFKHLDVLGTIMILTVGMGYAKPVPVNSRNFRNYKRDMILVALAGPISNFLMALVAMVLYRLLPLFVGNHMAPYLLIGLLLSIVIDVNISLMVFNLLPVPPLDGSRLWSSLLPARWSYALEQYSRYIAMGLMMLIFIGALDLPLYWLRFGAYKVLELLTAWTVLF